MPLMIAALLITDSPSPNHGPRRGDAQPSLIILHHTAMDGLELARRRLCDPMAEVSCHYLIGRDGTALRLVPEVRRAWHAGVGAWGPITDVNSHSIGIELDHPGPLFGPDQPPFAAPMMEALCALLESIRRRWSIPPERVLGHSDISPGRKNDPGPRFDWAALAAAGHAVVSDVDGPGQSGPGSPLGPEAEGAGPARARAVSALVRIGYRLPVGLDPMGAEDALLEAARLRLDPAAAPTPPGGAPAPRLRARCADLAARFPLAPEAGHPAHALA
ncbi:MAG: N-acetylmuramoyl-L-alanine amidase [Paracoccaceae bacterium]|jgi:N-acetylmuramoyl-L-alanine amidase